MKARVSPDRSNIAAERFPAAPIFIRSTATSIVRGNAATPAQVIAGSVIRDGHTRVSVREQTIIIQFPEFLRSPPFRERPSTTRFTLLPFNRSSRLFGSEINTRQWSDFIATRSIYRGRSVHVEEIEIISMK